MLSRKISGEDLVKEPRKSNPKRVVIAIAAAIAIFLLGLFVLRFISAYITSIGQEMRQSGHNLLNVSYSMDSAFNMMTDFQNLKLPFEIMVVLILGSLVLGFVITKRIGYLTRPIAYGQKGDSRLATLDEIKQQYKEIPDKKKSFEGYGGIPISHYRHKYYIDTETVHNIIIGTSRSGKTQMLVFQMIDNLSRAEKQSSLVVNDPKGELYNASVNTLKDRGYDVYLLNMADGSQSMSYNPLSVIIKAWQQGDIERGMQLVNSLTYTLYHNDNAGANSWVYEGAQKAVNGMIIALIDRCIKDGTPEKITLNNIIDMLNEMGTVDYAKNPANPFDKTNVLDEFFKNLPQGSIAKREFGSTSFSGDKAKGSIYSTIIQKLSVFSMPKNARMTSMNTLDLKTIGFPKYLSFKIPEEYYNKRIKIIFLNVHNKKKAVYIVKVGFGGFVEYNFDVKLHTGDKFIIKYIDEKNPDNKISSSYQLNFSEQNDAHEVRTRQLVDKLPVDDLKVVYSDKPIAVFMKIPDYDSSNNDLASIFVSQLYSELAKQCDFVQGNKTIIRVHCILEEFGNMIQISDFDKIMTVSAGRNILFTNILQSYSQMFNLYGEKKGQTIKENGQNQILIKTTDDATLREFSEHAGMRTTEQGSVNKTMMNTNQSLNVQSDATPILTKERLDGMLKGECLVLRPLHREDLKHNLIRPFPIFNTKKTKMPYAYRFLKPWFNPENDPNLLDIYSPHASLDLQKLSIDFSKYVDFNDQAAEAFKAAHHSVNETAEERAAKFVNAQEELDDTLDETQYEKESAEDAYTLDVLRLAQQSIEVSKICNELLNVRSRAELNRLTSRIKDTSIRKELERLFDQNN